MNGGPPAQRAGFLALETEDWLQGKKEEGKLMSIFRAIFYFLYEIFLGCSHKHLTRPFTLEQETYMV